MPKKSSKSCQSTNLCINTMAWCILKGWVSGRSGGYKQPGIFTIWRYIPSKSLKLSLSWSPIISLFSAIKSKNSISLPLTHNTNAQPFYLFLHHLHILHFQRQTLGLFICWICSCRHFLYYCFVARKFHQIFIQMKYIYIHRILLYCQKK